MIYEHDEELVRSAAKIQRLCRIIRNVCIGCMACFALFWCLLAAAIVVTYPHDNAFWISLCNTAVFGIAVTVILVSLARLFSDAVAKSSPFTANQSKRLVTVAAMITLLAFNDVIFPMDATMHAHLFSQEVGFEVTTSGVFVAPTLNAGMLFFAILLLCLSVIFKYGFLLQQLNDDTV